MSANPHTLRAGPVALAPKGASSTVSDGLAEEAADREELQSLLAFSAMHGQVRRSVAKTVSISWSPSFAPEREDSFALEEVLQLVTERALKVADADGVAMALADDRGMAVRAQSGEIRPDVGQNIDMEASFSSTCFRTAQLLICDDCETDDRVNRMACGSLGARSILAVPVRGQSGVVGILEAFSKNASAFDGTDARHLTLLAELVTEAFTADDEERLAKCALAVAEKLQPAPSLPKKPVANSMMRTSLSETKDSGETREPQMPPHRSVPAAIASIVAARQAGMPAKRYVEPSVPIAPDPETQESYRRSTLFLTWFVVIAGAFVVGFGWRIGTAPKLSAVGLRVNTVQSASTRNPNQASIVPAQSTSGVDTKIAPKTASTTNTSLQGLANFSRVTGIQYLSGGDSTTVMIASDSPVQYKAHRLTGPERIFFDLADTKLAPGLAKEPIQVEDATLRRIRAAQTAAGVTRVVLETTGKADYSVTPEANPPGLKIELRQRNPGKK